MSEVYHRWQTASGGPGVNIASRAMAEIKAHVIRGFKSLPKRGAEIGGVLLGSRNPENGEIVVEAFEPIQIEYSFGPSYIPSEADYSGWNDWIRALRESSPRIVGLCRSQTRPGLRVAPEDGNLIQHVMPDGDGVLLIVKPLSERECVAAFFPFVRGVVIDGTTPSREFPFGAALHAADPEPPVQERRQLQPLSRWIVVTAVAAGVGAAGVLHYMVESPPENPVPSSLSH